MAASVSSRSRGAATASAAASAAADLIVSLSWLMISPPEEPKQQGAFFHWSLVTNPAPGMVLRAQGSGEGQVPFVPGDAAQGP